MDRTTISSSPSNQGIPGIETSEESLLLDLKAIVFGKMSDITDGQTN